MFSARCDNKSIRIHWNGSRGPKKYNKKLGIRVGGPAAGGVAHKFAAPPHGGAGRDWIVVPTSSCRHLHVPGTPPPDADPYQLEPTKTFLRHPWQEGSKSAQSASPRDPTWNPKITKISKRTVLKPSLKRRLEKLGKL